MTKSWTWTPFFALAMALSAHAQGNVERHKDRPDTVRIGVSGGFDTDWVWRSVGLATAMGLGDDGQGTIEANANVRLDAELSDKVSVVLNLATQRLDGGAVVGDLGNDGDNVMLWDLAVKLEDVLDENVSVIFGTQNDLTFDPRGRGTILFFDPAHSGSFDENLDGVGDFTGNSDWQQPAGLVVHYAPETFQVTVALLPAISEGGASSDDEAAYAALLYYNLDGLGKGSRLGVLAAVNAFPGGNTAVTTFGGGVTLRDLAMTGLELFAEAYVQGGDAGTDGADEDLEAGGSAFHLGARYEFPDMDSHPWVELSFTQLSGDDDDTDTDVDGFLSYENVNDLLVLESSYFGVNWNTNMTVVKAMGGISWTVGQGMQNNLALKGVVGIASTTEDVDLGGGESSDELGTEVDVVLTYFLNKQVQVDVQAGFLMGSDLLEEATGGSASDDSEDSAAVFTAGLSGKF